MARRCQQALCCPDWADPRGLHPPGGWEVSIWARNLTNKDYLTECINPNGISWLGKPRQWGAELTKRF